MSRQLRHSGAHTRYRFIRVALMRRRTFLTLEGDCEYYLCHPDKRWHRGADRAAGERAWRREWHDDIVDRPQA